MQTTPRPTSSLASLSSIGAILVTLTLVSILWLDRPIATESHALLRDYVASIRPFDQLADFFVWTAVLILLGAAPATAAGWRPGPRARLFIVAAATTLIALALKEQLKFAFGRTWPETWVDNNPSWIKDGIEQFQPFHGGRGWASFPSGHTTAVAAPMLVIWRMMPAWRWLAGLVIAAMIAILLAANFHYLGDCLGGLTVALASASGMLALARPDRDWANGT